MKMVGLFWPISGQRIYLVFWTNFEFSTSLLSTPLNSHLEAWTGLFAICSMIDISSEQLFYNVNNDSAICVPDSKICTRYEYGHLIAKQLLFAFFNWAAEWLNLTWNLDRCFKNLKLTFQDLSLLIMFWTPNLFIVDHKPKALPHNFFPGNRRFIIKQEQWHSCMIVKENVFVMRLFRQWFARLA